MCGGIFFVNSEEEMMKTQSCLKIFGSFNYFVELFKPPNRDLGCHISNNYKLPKTEKRESQELNHESRTLTNSKAAF
jgi:hypothetical protein